MPQYFKQNNPIIFLGIKCMSRETVRQYQVEERTLIKRRVNSANTRLDDMLAVMSMDELAPKAHVARLADELGEHYGSKGFLHCETMGELVLEQLSRLELAHTGL
jgi:hypothetical protein